MTNRERVLELLCSELVGLTDSEIRERTGIQPHQQVNQICRSLARAGLIERHAGPHGRLVNLPPSFSSEKFPARSTQRTARQVRGGLRKNALVPLWAPKCRPCRFQALSSSSRVVVPNDGVGAAQPPAVPPWSVRFPAALPLN